jgi:hypothetical protein
VSTVTNALTTAVDLIRSPDVIHVVLQLSVGIGPSDGVSEVKTENVRVHEILIFASGTMVKKYIENTFPRVNFSPTHEDVVAVGMSSSSPSSQCKSFWGGIQGALGKYCARRLIYKTRLADAEFLLVTLLIMKSIL